MVLFGKGTTFAGKIRKVASAAGLKIVEATENLVVVNFMLQDGRHQKVFLAPVGELQGYTIVDIWSVVQEVTGDYPQHFANRLLRENGSHKVGYWGIETIGGHSHLGCHHAMVLDTLDPAEFKVIVLTLAIEADQMEKELQAGDVF